MLPSRGQTLPLPPGCSDLGLLTSASGDEGLRRRMTSGAIEVKRLDFVLCPIPRSYNRDGMVGGVSS